MHLKRFEVRNFRNLTSVSLSPVPGLNILEGNNGSGKTSFLEAIHMLGVARSFRTNKTNQLVQHQHSYLVLFAELSNSAMHRLGIQRYKDNRMVIRLDGENLHRRSELAQLIPIQTITPDSLLLLTGTPTERRQYLDWMLFHVEPSFYEIWSAYQRALKQRNVLLRECRVSEVPSWTHRVVEDGIRINQLRVGIVDEIKSHMDFFIDQLLPGLDVIVNYRHGWKIDKSFEEAVTDSLENDFKLKYTTVGPHRAELAFCVDGERAVDILSRGQLKLLLCALKLSQLAYIKEATGKSAIVLVDDLSAELDEKHRSLLLRLLHNLDTQVFVTTTDRSHLDYSSWRDIKVFHVEHGQIKEVV